MHLKASFPDVHYFKEMLNWVFLPSSLPTGHATWDSLPDPGYSEAIFLLRGSFSYSLLPSSHSQGVIRLLGFSLHYCRVFTLKYYILYKYKTVIQSYINRIELNGKAQQNIQFECAPKQLYQKFKILTKMFCRQDRLQDRLSWVWIPQPTTLWSLYILPVPVWVISRYAGFVPHSKNMQVRLTGDSKLTIGVNRPQQTVNLSRVQPPLSSPVTPNCSSGEKWEDIHHQSKVWPQNISGDDLMKLIDRLPRVCKAVIEAKGGYVEECKI